MGAVYGSLYVWVVFNDTATSEIYTLSLHDALPICRIGSICETAFRSCAGHRNYSPNSRRDRKSTRLNSSHATISYAVLCLTKKNNGTKPRQNNLNNRKNQLHIINILAI